METDIQLSQHLEENVEMDEDFKKLTKNVTPSASVGPILGFFRSAISEERLCAHFCGGKKCKYCNPKSHFQASDMAIDGLYSHWVTENIVAISRPSTRLLKEFRILESFEKLGIRSIVNLQRPGEHASCGDGVDPGSGFSYSYHDFMESQVYFYNFGWKDYGTAPMHTLLDMVRVMQFALSEGKVAVHCHAGLGRTGVIIACYLVFNNRLNGSESIHFVRKKRPGSLQTRDQVQCVLDFHDFLRPFRLIYHIEHDKDPPFNVFEHLRRQNAMLHGIEARRLKHLPKVLYICVNSLLDIALGKKRKQSAAEKEKLRRQHRRSIVADAPLAFDRDNLRLPGNEPYVRTTRRSSLDMDDDSPKRGTVLLRQHLNSAPHSDSSGDEDLDRDTLTTKRPNPRRSTSRHRRRSSSGSEEDTAREDSRRREQKQHRSSSFTRSARGRHEPEEESTASDTMTTRDWSADLADSITQRPLAKLPETSKTLPVAEAFLASSFSKQMLDRVAQMKINLNTQSDGWKTLRCDFKDMEGLSLLILDWLETLKTPVLRGQDILVLCDESTDVKYKLKYLEKPISRIVQYLACFVAALQPLPDDVDEKLIERLLSALSQQHVYLDPHGISQASVHGHNNHTVDALYHHHIHTSPTISESGSNSATASPQLGVVSRTRRSSAVSLCKRHRSYNMPSLQAYHLIRFFSSLVDHMEDQIRMQHQAQASSTTSSPMKSPTANNQMYSPRIVSEEGRLGRQRSFR